MLLSIQLLFSLTIRQFCILSPFSLFPKPVSLQLSLLWLRLQVSDLLAVFLGLNFARLQLGVFELDLLRLSFIRSLRLLKLRIFFHLLLSYYIEFTLAFTDLGLILQLKVFRFLLLFLEHWLGWIQLLHAEVFLLLAPLLFHLEALLQLCFGKGKRVVFLLLGEHVRAILVNVAAQSYDLLIFHRQVLLVLLSGLVRHRRCSIDQLLRAHGLLRSLLCDAYMTCIDGSLVYHLYLFS